MISSRDAKTGKHIPPVHRLRIMSANDWEEFIEEWIDSLKSEYIKVDKLGGAGDKGRDVVAQVNDTGVWDNYQCKHYDHPLTPTDIWAEIGKLVYYTSIGDFTCPRHYYFIAPQGIGTKLSTLLQKPKDLVDGLIENWDNYCKKKITKNCDIKLSDVQEQILK